MWLESKRDQYTQDIAADKLTPSEATDRFQSDFDMAMLAGRIGPYAESI